MTNDYEDIPNSAIIRAIDEYVHSERDRVIMKRYLCDDISMFDISLEMGISFKTVQRAVIKQEPIIFRHI